MKKTILLILSLTMAVMSHAQIIYRISGNGLQKDSYILGTEHVIGGSFLFQIPGAFAAFNSAELICGELSLSEMSKQSTDEFMTDGKTLKDVMTAEEFQRLDDCCLQLLGKRLSDEATYAQMGKMYPTMISTLLNVVFVMKKNPPHMNIQNGIDAYIMQMAAQKGKSTIGLETMEYQKSVLFDEPIEKQVESLMCLVDNMEAYRDLTNNLTDAYLTQNIETIEKAMFAKIGNKCDSTPEEEDKLIFNRNRNWVEKMPEMMKARSTFFTVGVGHLCGEKSVLALLKKKGYTVEPLTSQR